MCGGEAKTAGGCGVNLYVTGRDARFVVCQMTPYALAIFRVLNGEDCEAGNLLVTEVGAQ